jgi:hypothetical protein
MPYDAKLDKQVFSKFWENDTTKLTVSIYSYNNGAQKLQISRENKNAEGENTFAKLGRMTKEEAQAILPYIQEAITQIQ